MAKAKNPTHFDNHEAVIDLYYPPTNLPGVISIHNSLRGPATGGTRLWKYRTKNSVIADANDLARTMTYKCAIHELDHGGGKTVFNRDPKIGLTPEELQWYAEEINKLEGRFWTGEDIGFTVDYVNQMSRYTKYVTGKSKEFGGGGDPSLRTAEGLMHAIHACLTYKNLSHYDLFAHWFVVQGAGKVGFPLIKKLIEQNAMVFFCDTDKERAAFVQQACPEATAIDPSSIFEYEIDFFVPCGKGGTVNRETIPRIAKTGCQFIVPSANNVLGNSAKDARMLQRFNILLAPDYVVNGGGIINIASEMLPGGYNDLWAKEKTQNIFNLLLCIFAEAEKSGMTTVEVADNIARSHLLRNKIA
ncbi:MAG: phenylalanine dehydrogenase [Parcubacteria group bacterium Gr01-1014_48]|nr:MAG: phenylalanine dehydrogenase [Parcubacteria group bacterium Greene0416_14]TSC71810.1 MAG: phenylalanine dehydrogenase [Parcubacteria group bacterium Gr01-1014_48]TSD01125.1 MAG: phenylalanine dehydrogenase [Parcubacteria group bacterium Greene1014_15]TSD08201.1 MAG: phenylalanine dehydrogenase [Parcubacteria group bacterium Greene0714_4]